MASAVAGTVPPAGTTGGGSNLPALAATLAPYRTFKFFESESLKTSVDNLEITTAACGRHLVFFGDNEGYIRSFDRSTLNSLVHEFRGYESCVTHMKMVRGARTVLVTIGDDHAEVGIVRLWNTDQRNLTGDRWCAQHKLFEVATSSAAAGASRSLLSAVSGAGGALLPPPAERQPLRSNYNADLDLKWFGNPVRAADSDGASSTAGGSTYVGGGPARGGGGATTQSGAAATTAIENGEFTSSRSVVSCIVTFDVTDDLQYLAVALTSGEIIVIRGELDQERSKAKMKRFNSKHVANMMVSAATSTAAASRVEGGKSAGAITNVGFSRPRVHHFGVVALGGGGGPAVQQTGQSGPLPTLTGAQSGSQPAQTASYSMGLFAVFERATVYFYIPFRIVNDPYEERMFHPLLGALPECSTVGDDGLLYLFPSPTCYSAATAANTVAGPVAAAAQSAHPQLGGGPPSAVGNAVAAASVLSRVAVFGFSNSFLTTCFGASAGAGDQPTMATATTGISAMIPAIIQPLVTQYQRDGDAVYLRTEVEGEKRKIAFHRNYLLILAKPDGAGGGPGTVVASSGGGAAGRLGGGPSATAAGAAAPPPPPNVNEKFVLSLIDTEARIRGVSSAQATQSNIAWVLPDTPDILVVAQDPKSDRAQHKVTRYAEVELQNKLDQLFKRDLYDEAKKVASRHGGGSGNAAGAATASGAAATGAAGGGATLFASLLQTLMSHHPASGSSGGNANAADANADEASLTLKYAIQKKYGDHLYEKNKYDKAIEQYIEAIRAVEPSYVIQRYLDAQRITELTRYLEALHLHEKLVNVNHTTLLLNCYAKLKADEKLTTFINRDDVSFDAVNAISVCCQAGYDKAATQLAKKYNQPSLYVQILIETLQQFSEAIVFVKTLPLSVARTVLRQHGKLLLSKCPAETTEALVLLCTKWAGGTAATAARGKAGGATASSGNNPTILVGPGGQKTALNPQAAGAASSAGAAPTTAVTASPYTQPTAFIPAFVDAPLWLLHFVRSVAQHHFRPTATATTGAAANSGTADGASQQVSRWEGGTVADAKVLFNTMLELYLTKDLKSRGAIAADGGSGIVGGGAGGAASGGPGTDLATPAGGSDAAVVQSQTNASAFAQPPVESYDQRLELALRVIEEYPGLYCPHHALMLVRQAPFERGVLAMLRTLNMPHEIFQYHAKEFESSPSDTKRLAAKTELFNTCELAERTSGKTDVTRSMWVALASLLVRSKDDCSRDITRILKKIEEDDLLAPVAVLDLLSACTSLPLKAVRPYIINMVRREQARIDKLQTAVADLTEKTKKTRDDIYELQTTAVIFQSTKCAYCQRPLELPAVHFMCRHSFHQQCLSDFRACQICGPEHQKVFELQAEYERQADDHETFFKALRQSAELRQAASVGSPAGSVRGTAAASSASTADAFSVVAEQFGRGIFGAKQSLGNQRRWGAASAMADDADDDVDDDGPVVDLHDEGRGGFDRRPASGVEDDEEDVDAIVARESW